MCGIFGIVSTQTHGLPLKIREHLLKIQHRGYDGAGLALVTKPDLNRIILHKDYGLIKDVLTDSVLEAFSRVPIDGYGLGHTRYKTVGECSAQSSQPLLSVDGKLCLAHNGQIVHHENPDSSLLLEYFDKQKPTTIAEVESIIMRIFQEVQGSYSCLLLIQDLGLIAFRDPHGIRPLAITQNIRGDYLFASESVAFQINPNNVEEQYAMTWDLPPGSYAFCYLEMTSRPLTPIQKKQSQQNHQSQQNGLQTKYYQKQLFPNPVLTPCIFEYIYLSHWRSTINNIPVERSRKILGILLADKILEEHPERQIDLVIPVPSTSKIAAKALADKLGVEYLELIRLNPNRKYPRSFILPTQEMRELAVADKFQLDPSATEILKNKKVLLVDDSVIRGTTLRCLVKMFRTLCPDIDKIKVASIAPKVVNKNIYGIDIPNTNNLIAYQKTDDEISEILGTDWIVFQDLDRMLRAFKRLTHFDDFEHSIFVSNQNPIHESF